jgi:uncharacterized protein
VLKGLSSTYSKSSAVKILRDYSEQGNPLAMNALGIAYMYGLGVDKDSTAAFLWLERSGEGGYLLAYHNLGMIFKEPLCGVQQDFTKASLYFNKGAGGGSIECGYDMGYMLYKGLGCKQDYMKAAELFQQGSDKDYSPSLYMLGLCYRNGYGLEQDTARANYLLRRASILNFGAAYEELRREQPENNIRKLSLNDSILEIPPTVPSITPTKIDTSLIKGTYQGAIVVYDWSGKNVIKEIPLEVKFYKKNDSIVGNWFEGKDTIIIHATISENELLKFQNSYITKNDRYKNKEKRLYRFEDADVNTENDCLVGNLRLYSMSQKEPERPMYLCLQKKDSLAKENILRSDSLRNIDTKLIAYPNPFFGQITCEFNLPQATANIQIGLYNRAGMCVYNAKIGSLTTGKQTVTITPAVIDGVYIMMVKAGEYMYQTIVIKKNEK